MEDDSTMTGGACPASRGRRRARRRAPALLAALVLLAGCGGDGGSPVAPPASPGTRLQPDVAPSGAGGPPAGARGVSGSGTHLGIGPAFAGQSPAVGDLPASPEAARRGFGVRSGHWRDPQGRDGSAGAAEAVRFLKAFQAQAYREFGSEADLVAVAFRPKTLRVHWATGAERALVRAVLAEINTALPRELRIRLGRDLSRPIDAEAVPDGEIHLGIASGKAGWPDFVEESGDFVTAGIGGAHVDPGTFAVLGGHALVDRRAARSDAALLRYVILHEILHAYGLGAHVDPDEHPLSVMRPTTERFEDVPPVFVSLDGEALLAETHVAPGTPVSAIAAGDLGPWTDTAFHLLGHAEPGDTGDGLVRFGAGFRNGLAKPWVWGPVPDGRLGDNPGLSGTAAWTGALLGFSGSGRTVAGDALVRIDIGSLDGSAAFSNLESWGRFAHPGRPGSGTMWGDGDLGYSIEVVHGEAGDGFVSASAPGDDPGVVTGAFVGAAHEGAAGVLEHPDLSAAFGATR